MLEPSALRIHTNGSPRGSLAEFDGGVLPKVFFDIILAPATAREFGGVIRTYQPEMLCIHF